MVYPYVWIVVVGAIVGFLTGCGVGMNDLANAFGTTYGAKILKLWQICILASICEFAGAVSLGGAVSSTISGGIANPEDFATKPYVYMYGMLCASGAAFCWLAVATLFRLPVSSTHSIIGGVIGFALVHGGGGSVKWANPQDDFPFVGGVVPVIASWFISPTLTGAVAAIIYNAIRFFVLRPANSVNRAIFTLPIVIAVTFFLEAFFILFKGASKKLKWGVGRAAWVAAIIGVGTGALSCALIPVLRSRVRKMTAAAAEAARVAALEPCVEEGAELSAYEGVQVVRVSDEQRSARHSERASVGAGEQDAAFSPADVDAPQADGVNEEREADANGTADFAEPRKQKKDTQSEVDGAVVRSGSSSGSEVSSDDDRTDASLSATEVNTADAGQLYDSKAEYVYRYLQIFTAVCASFAHGASDVSNAIGPLAAIWGIYQEQSVEFSSDAPIWILCIGAAGIVVGLSTFGARLMSLLGEKITLITPSRGFSAELSAALVVSFASAYGIPVSSTHCITGAVVAISICDVGFRRTKWLMVLKMYAGWIGTLVITGVVSAAFFAQGVYTPNV